MLYVLFAIWPRSGLLMKGLLVAAKQEVTFCGFNKCLKSHLQKKKKVKYGKLINFWLFQTII